MDRITAVSLLGLLSLTIAPFGFGQTSSAQSRDRRLEDALVDITLLKRLVKEQDRRTTDLEKIVKSLQTAAASSDKPGGEDRVRITARAPAARWQVPLAWGQIKEGMSRAQVEELLGKPVSVDAVIDYQTLVYKGDVPGAGMLSGTVKLTDDRVSQVSPPGF